MTKEEKEMKNNRRLYSKPQIEQVKLEAEEAVLAACKGPKGAGPNDKNCKLPGSVICMTIGS